MKLLNKKDYWEKIIKEFELNNGNLNRKKWCEERNISLKAFAYWFSRYSTSTKSKYKITETVDNPVKTPAINETLSKANWIEIKVPESKVQNDIRKESSIKIQIGKAEITLSDEFDKNLFKDVAKILGEIC